MVAARVGEYGIPDLGVPAELAAEDEVGGASGPSVRSWIEAWAIIPGSATTITRPMRKRVRRRATSVRKAVLSAALPGRMSQATGQPCRSTATQSTTWGCSGRRSREKPRRRRGVSVSRQTKTLVVSRNTRSSVWVKRSRSCRKSASSSASRFGARRPPAVRQVLKVEGGKPWRFHGGQPRGPLAIVTGRAIAASPSVLGTTLWRKNRPARTLTTGKLGRLSCG